MTDGQRKGYAVYRKIIYTTKIMEAPEITSADLMSISDAAEFLAVSVQTVDYHIRSGQIVAVIAPEDELTSYKRHRRWVLRSEVEGLKIAIIDNKLNGADWRAIGNEIFLWLPEVEAQPTTKGDPPQAIRHLTLTQQDTGDLEIDVIARRENGHCSIRVDVQSEVRYPNMAGIEIVLNLPDDQRTEKTDKSGGVVFSRVRCSDLPQARLTIKTPTTT